MKRLQQVLKNLLSNAFKFTAEGGVKLKVSPAVSGWNEDHPMLRSAASVVAFEVSDTGIGIPPEKQQHHLRGFPAGRRGHQPQVRRHRPRPRDQPRTRKSARRRDPAAQRAGRRQRVHALSADHYMGSGLARAPAGGAEAPPPPRRSPSRPVGGAAAEQILDDRDTVAPGESVVLIVEDDPHFARLMMGAAKKGFKVLVASRGTEALALAREHHPTAISLDIFLPDMLGWTVLSQLKQDPATRHIPVQIVTLDEDRHHGLARGAFSFVQKPASSQGLDEAFARIKGYAAPRRKRLLLVEDDQNDATASRSSWVTRTSRSSAETGTEALAQLKRDRVDCVVLDLKLPDMSGFEVLETIRDDAELRDIPVVVFTGRELSADEDATLHTMARSVVVKGVESPERLLDETALFLHRVVADLPPAKQRMLERLHSSDEDLLRRTVLLVDDDARNIFALSSVLERRGMEVLTATTGSEAIAVLSSREDVAIVLMDIMMPGMDGYETIQEIRSKPAFRRLPILALTAKAMKGDREKCLEAGASDYLAKPVNVDQLLSALRMWLHR